MKKKKIILGLAGAAAAGAGVIGGIAALGGLLYRATVSPAPYNPEPEGLHTVLREGREWVRAGEDFRTLTIEAHDGLVLWGAFCPGAADSHCWAICVHGWRSCHEAMGAAAKIYWDMGYHVILPDLRGHGNSQGDYVGWGYDDGMDMVAWIDHVVRRDPEARIVLHGVSMGAASVLMATGGPLCRQVKAAVSDCGYTSALEVMEYIVDTRGRAALPASVPIPVRPMTALLRRATLRRAGYDIGDAAPIEAVKRSRIPTLFIHGLRDDVVPPSMGGSLYEAAGCPKDYLWVEDAGHTEACAVDPEGYRRVLEQFLGKYMEL